jgi:hypothetical protein
MYGVIGFFVMLSFWGLVNIIDNTLKLDNQQPDGINTNIPAGSINAGASRDIRDLPDVQDSQRSEGAV